MIPTHRAPTPPGEILREEFLRPLGLTQAQLASHIGVSAQTISRLVNGKASVSADMAWRLSLALGTTPELWLALQGTTDLWRARREGGASMQGIGRIGEPAV